MLEYHFWLICLTDSIWRFTKVVLYFHKTHILRVCVYLRVDMLQGTCMLAHDRMREGVDATRLLISLFASSDHSPNLNGTTIPGFESLSNI